MRSGRLLFVNYWVGMRAKKKRKEGQHFSLGDKPKPFFVSVAFFELSKSHSFIEIFNLLNLFIL